MRCGVRHPALWCHFPQASFSALSFGSRNGGRSSLLPFCYSTTQYGARQDGIRQRPMLENSEVIQTSRHSIVDEVITAIELRMVALIVAPPPKR